jgi:nucleotide-binding universal stress UspA family protein
MPDRLIHRILAFVELTDGAEPDMQFAIELARQLGSELILFSVIDRPAMVSLIGTHRAATAVRGDTLTATLVGDAERILQRIVDAAAKRGVGARGHALVSEEVPEQILKEAVLQHVDLIVVRSSGRSGFLKKLMGSTVEEVLSAAPCPVLVASST